MVFNMLKYNIAIAALVTVITSQSYASTGEYPHDFTFQNGLQTYTKFREDKIQDFQTFLNENLQHIKSKKDLIELHSVLDLWDKKGKKVLTDNLLTQLRAIRKKIKKSNTSVESNIDFNATLEKLNNTIDDVTALFEVNPDVTKLSFRSETSDAGRVRALQKTIRRLDGLRAAMLGELNAAMPDELRAAMPDELNADAALDQAENDHEFYLQQINRIPILGLDKYRTEPNKIHPPRKGTVAKVAELAWEHRNSLLYNPDGTKKPLNKDNFQTPFFELYQSLPNTVPPKPLWFGADNWNIMYSQTHNPNGTRKNFDDIPESFFIGVLVDGQPLKFTSNYRLF